MKKLLNSLYILDETAYLSLDGENIVCKFDEKPPMRVPLVNLEDIYVFGYSGCSPALMGKCAQEGVALNFFTPNGSLLAHIRGKTKGNIYLRAEQFRLFTDPPLILAQNTVAAKLYNTCFVLKRSLKDYPQIDEDGKVSECIAYLKEQIETVYEYNDRDTIMGVEGSCAKQYFAVFDRMILKQKEDFYLTSRTKRPPLDRVNAVLSFLYTIFTSHYASALEGVGLDSFMGYFHTMRPGRSSLACDLVEESRCIVERLVLTMINLKILNADDFETQSSGAVMPNSDGRKKVITQWQEKKRSQIMHPYLKQKIPIGLLPFVQSNLLAKYVRGEISEYPCYLQK